MSVEERRGRRVVASHSIARSAFLAAGGFGIVSLGWAGWTLWQGGSWWGPLHAFLAGVILLAISGAAQMFTITWAAAPAPPGVVSDIQRWAMTVGVGLVLIGVPATAVWTVLIGAGLVVAGLALLAYSLWSAVQRSLLRRFDLSARFYLLALLAGIVGVVLGAVMGVDGAGASYVRVRLVHSHLNLVGLVGLTIVGTLPTILPTFAHHKAVSGKEARLAWWLAVLAVVSTTSGLGLSAAAVGVGSILAAVALSLILIGVLARLGRRGLSGGLPYLQVTCGALWLGTWALIDGVRLLAGDLPSYFSSWTAAVVIAGIGQVLLGSLAYLLPVLAGSHPLLGRNIAKTHALPWVPFGLANLAGIGFLLGEGVVSAILVGLWAADFIRRILRMEWSSRIPASH